VLAANDLPQEAGPGAGTKGGSNIRRQTDRGSMTKVPPEATTQTRKQPPKEERAPRRRQAAWLVILVPMLLVAAGFAAVFFGQFDSRPESRPSTSPAVASVPETRPSTIPVVVTTPATKPIPVVTVPATKPSTPSTRPVTSGTEARRHFEMGVEAFKQRMFEQSIVHFTEAVRHDPEFALALVQRGRAHAARADHAKAVADFTAALKYPTCRNAETYHDRGASHEELRKDGEAVADYGEAIKLDPKDAGAYLGRARVRVRQKEYEPAIDDCDEALKINPKLAAALVVRGTANAQQQKLGPAFEDYDKALKADPQLTGAYIGRGDVLRELGKLEPGKLEPAIEDYRRALELESGNVRARSGLGEAYQRLGLSYFTQRDPDRFDRAITYFSERLRKLEAAERATLTCEIGCAYAQRGRAWQQRGKSGDLDRAIHDYDEALQRTSDDAFASLYRGDIHAQMQDVKKADADLSRAVELNPKELKGWYLHGHLRLQQGDLDGYRKVCKGLYTNLAQTKDLSDINHMVWLCVLAPDSGVDPKELVPLATKVVEGGNPKQIYVYLNTLGSALYRAGRDREALERLSEAIAMRPGKQGVVDDWLFLALVQQRLGNVNDARRWRDQALDAIDAELKAKPKPGTLPMSWSRRVELQALRKEVAEKVGKP
jgi:tetratricopeptide (TPR) repeat protein